MPIVTIDVVCDTFTTAQKRDLIGRVTDAMVAVEGEAMRDLTWVRINEVAEGDLGIGGRPLTAFDFHRMAAERADDVTRRARSGNGRELAEELVTETKGSRT